MSRRTVAPLPAREWLTTDEAAAWLGCSKDTIARAKAASELSPKKRRERGGPDYYRITELRAWVETWEDA
ncbi:MAG: hypothetical protein ACREVJ_09315 [Gammaproteobacteria bacterium]